MLLMLLKHQRSGTPW